MSAAKNTVTASAPSATARFPRLDSLDVFRGLTMFLMLFANDMNDPDLGHVANVPDWLRHMPGGRDGMTFVDVIFPAFLFGAGLSIPLALGRRVDAGDRAGAFRHVAWRSLWLVVIGLGMVNTYRFHPTAIPISPAWWEFLFFVAVIVVWQSPPAAKDGPKPASRLWKILGAAALVVLAVIYRGSSGGEATWMRTSWWGILTIIGIAYFVVAGGYLLLRKSLAGLTGLLALLIAVNIGDRNGALAVLDPLRGYFSAGGLFGGLPAIMAAGTIAGCLLFEAPPGATDSTRLRSLVSFGLALCFAGLLLYPPFGLSKPSDTPAWCLLCSAICCVLFAFLYWLVDLKRIGTWAGFVRPAGRHPLLTYFLPHLFYSLLAILGITWLEQNLNSGVPGILRSLVLALGFLGVTALLVRKGVVLKL